VVDIEWGASVSSGRSHRPRIFFEEASQIEVYWREIVKTKDPKK